MTNAMNGTRKTFIQYNTSVQPYRIVKAGTDANSVIAATAATDKVIGVTDESADGVAGNPVGVILDGVVKLCILAASTKDDYIIATTAGKGATGSTDKDKIIGQLLETTTVANQVAQVRLMPGVTLSV